jgi:site-specific recombinase XerD
MPETLTHRPLGRHHLAFFRGTLDGLPLDRLGDLYLETGGDVRQAKRTLTWIRDQLIFAAKRYHQERKQGRALGHGLPITGASLVRLLKNVSGTVDATAAVSSTPDLPSLDDFQADYDPTGFYSEAELIAEFTRRYGGNGSGQDGAGGRAIAAQLRKAEQNDRLRRRMRQAIDALEQRIVTTPNAGDPIEIWIDPVLAKHLLTAGIVSIEELVGVINRRGHYWHRTIPRFGRIKARRVVKFLQLNQVLPIDERALVPYRHIAPVLKARRQPGTGIVPIEHLALSAALDGSLGSNRGIDSQIEATRDLQAIQAWLQIKCDNEHTRRAYTTQAERFLCFLTIEQGRALSDATPGNCHAYTTFLAALATPGAEWPYRTRRPDWIGPKVPRWSADWRPFTGELSASSRKTAITILNGLFAWLSDVGYLRRNPWVTVNTPKAAGRIKVEHVLNERQWKAINAVLEAMPYDEPMLRLRFLLWLGYSTGLRQDELRRLTAGNLRRTPEGEWDLVFLGKGCKERDVPLAPAVMSFLTDYLDARGHGRNPLLWPSSLPLISSLGTEHQQVQKTRDQPLAARSMAQLIKHHFERAADRIEDLIDEHQLRQASTHWLRHTAATTLINHGAQVAVVQEILGHASAATTALYTHADRKRKREAVRAVVEG